MQAYSQDLRERVLRALDRGDRPTEIARRFEVSRIWVYQVRGREQETGGAPVFRSAAIAGRGWRKWNRCCALGSQPSPI
jgi:transposase